MKSLENLTDEGFLKEIPDIIIASLQGDVGLVESLLLAGQDVNSIDPSTGNTPLHIAAYQDNWDLAEILLSHRSIDPNIALLKRSCGLLCEEHEIVCEDAQEDFAVLRGWLAGSEG